MRAFCSSFVLSFLLGRRPWFFVFWLYGLDWAGVLKCSKKIKKWLEF
jgi:hypothetical protein